MTTKAIKRNTIRINATEAKAKTNKKKLKINNRLLTRQQRYSTKVKGCQDRKIDTNRKISRKLHNIDLAKSLEEVWTKDKETIFNTAEKICGTAKSQEDKTKMKEIHTNRGPK